MSSDQERADRILDEAIQASGARDPREFYRERLRELKQTDVTAYDRAVAHYRDVLVPGVARGDLEPLTAWTEYGRTLAELEAPGRTVVIDGTGRARPYEPPADRDALILHLPDEARHLARVVSLPPELTTAQRASYDWLAVGKQTQRE
ncbi:MAG TPA: hypothetical protein VGA70_14840 [Longimicrobiales bacterium]|jgi:hypothetical protein